MSCCGQGRMALKASPSGVLPTGVTPMAGSSMGRAATPMRYLGAAPVVVRGAFTGAAYPFSATRAVQMVDARDVAGLLKRGIFRRGP